VETGKELNHLYQQRWFYDPVVSITEGEEEVYDIEVDDPSHCFVGNGLVNHNTLQTIAALCFIWEKDPNLKSIVVTNKSVVAQWDQEFERFTEGVKRIVVTSKGGPKKRKKLYQEFLDSEGPTVLIINYSLIRTDFSLLQSWGGMVITYDECTAFKNPSSKVHQACKHLSSRAARVYGLTATLIKNRLMEGFGIYKVVVPWLFTTKTKFMDNYCIVHLQQIPGRSRRIPVVVGYRKRDIQAFKEKIDPFFLGRPKHAVATELPSLVCRSIKFPMSKDQKPLYAEALAGILKVGEDSEDEETNDSKITALIRCQQVVNHPKLVEREGKSAKFDMLLELLLSGELEGEKVIVFSRLKKMIDYALVPERGFRVASLLYYDGWGGGHQPSGSEGFHLL
jgi:SNF2 family DNA or RNA helicase